MNEVFAVQVLVFTRACGFTPSDFKRINVNGSGLSLGHSVGATAGRILATLPVRWCSETRGNGLDTRCIGGEQELAVLSNSPTERCPESGGVRSVGGHLKWGTGRPPVGTATLDVRRAG